MVSINEKDFERLMHLSRIGQKYKSEVIKFALKYVEKNIRECNETKNGLGADFISSACEESSALNSIKQQREKKLSSILKQFNILIKNFEDLGNEIKEDKNFLERVGKLIEVYEQIENMESVEELRVWLQKKLPNYLACTDIANEDFEKMSETISNKFDTDGMIVLSEHIDSLLTDK